MKGVIADGTRLDLETLDENKSWASGAGFSFDNAMPRDKDLIALGIDTTLNVDSGNPVTKTADNVYQVLADLKLKLDGQPLQSLYDVELKWYAWFVWGKKPLSKETPDIAAQAGKTAWVRFLLPVMLPKEYSPKAKLTLSGTWGTGAQLDSGAGFVLNSGTLYVTAYKGTLNKTQRKLGMFYTRRHSPTAVNGDGEKNCPAGNLRGIIMQTTDRSDSINTIGLRHGGHYYYNDVYYEEYRTYMNQKWGMKLLKEGDPDNTETDGLVVVDGQGLPSNGTDTKLYYNTTASKNLYILYVLRGKLLGS